MLLQFSTDSFCLLFSLFMALNFFLKLFLYFMKLILSLFSLDLSNSFLINTMLSNLFGNFILNLQILVTLFLLLWSQRLRNWSLKWASSTLFCHAFINLFFNCFFNSFLNMILQVSVASNIGKWLDSLVNDFRV